MTNYGVIHLDLFSGIGGFALGAELAGVPIHKQYHSDIEPYANSIYARHFPDSYNLGDLRQINGHALRTVNPGAEWIVTGGFPCQQISSVGRRSGIGTKDTPTDRSGLWFEMCRIIGELQPRFVVAENVRALTYRGLPAVLQSLAGIRFDARWEVISAESIGAPHLRERVWITAWPRAVPARSPADADVQRCDETGELAVGVIRRAVGTDQKADGPTHALRAWPDWAGPATKGNLASTPRLCRVDDGLPCQLDECRRRIRALGNAVVPQVAAKVFRSAMAELGITPTL